MCVWIGVFVDPAHIKPIKQLKKRIYQKKTKLKFEAKAFWDWMKLGKNKNKPKKNWNWKSKKLLALSHLHKVEDKRQHQFEKQSRTKNIWGSKNKSQLKIMMHKTPQSNTIFEEKNNFII